MPFISENTFIHVMKNVKSASYASQNLKFSIFNSSFQLNYNGNFETTEIFASSRTKPGDVLKTNPSMHFSF